MIYFQKQVDLLLSENERLRKEVEYQRKRADQAVDNLLMSKQLGQVSLVQDEHLKKTEKIIDDALAKMNLAGEASE